MFPEFEDSGIPTTKLDVEVSRKLIRLLIDFGKLNGGKNVVNNWQRFDPKDPYYLLIDENFSVKQGLPLQQRMQFWNTLPPVYWRYKHSQLKNRDEL